MSRHFMTIDTMSVEECLFFWCIPLLKTLFKKPIQNQEQNWFSSVEVGTKVFMLTGPNQILACQGSIAVPDANPDFGPDKQQRSRLRGDKLIIEFKLNN